MRYLFFIFISYIYLFSDAHIFVYHRFGDSNHKSTNTTLKELEKEFNYFKKNNYKVVPLQYIINKIKKKEKLQDNLVALTIDDAYESFYTNGFEIFKRYNYPFSLYVYIEATNRKYGDYMTWDQIKEVSKYGTIGLHSYSHLHLTHHNKEDIFIDTKKALDIFEKKLGYKAKSYAYPYGEYNIKVRDQLIDFGFDYILNQSTGSITKNTNPYDIYRIALVGDINLEEKLKYKTFKTKWIEPLDFPKNRILKKIIARVDPRYKQLKLYVSANGWRDIKVKNGIINENLHLYLKRDRTRIMLGPDFFTISNNIITKGKENAK